MSIESAVQSGRARAEKRMHSRCTIHRKGTGTTTDSSGNRVPAYATVLTDVPLRLDSLMGKSASGYRAILVGETETETERLLAHLPASTEGINNRDLIEVTSGERTGHVYQVIEASPADEKTALRLPIFEVQRPGGL